MISLDTNIVLRFLLDDVPEQTKRAAELIEQKTVYVTDVVVVEAIYVLEKALRLSRDDVVSLVADFLGFANVVHNPYFLLNAIELYRRHPGLSVVDCYAAAEAEAYKNTLKTFDKHLANQGGAQVTLL